jgi:alpha-tubulin suppressor-like RCC1 family protein
VPTLVTALVEVKQVAAGFDHTCALKTDGSVWCWGSNETGQLGDATTRNRTSPVLVTSLNRATQIAAGQGQTCAVTTDGTVWCWGLGYGPPNDSGSTRFSAVAVQMPIRGIAKQVAVGEVACVVAESGSVWCWGDNGDGQLGRGTWGLSVEDGMPAPALQLTEVIEVSVGNAHACARRRDGSIWCWGAPPAAGSAGCTVCREDYLCCPTPSESAPACDARDR